MKYLIDTDKMIDFLHGDESTIAVMANLLEDGVAVSAITRWGACLD